MSDKPEHEIVLHEEELELGAIAREHGSVRAKKWIETEDVSEVVPRAVEQAQVEHMPAGEGDSGEIETLPDGSISIPVLAEELVVTKRVVVRERIVIRKETVIEETEVRAELRRERLDIQSTEDSSTNDGGS